MRYKEDQRYLNRVIVVRMLSMSAEIFLNVRS